MKILVTGASGFVGANLCHRLLDGGYNFTGVDDLSFGNKDNFPKGCVIYFMDFKDIHGAINNYDVLIHLATSNIIYAMKNPIETFKNNAIAPVEFFDRFKGKIIYTSTASVYGNAESFPTKEDAGINLSNAYDSSKYIAELFLRERGNFTTLRLSNVYGRFQDQASPYCGVLGKFVDKYLEGKPLTIYGDGTATRDYTYVEDVVDAILQAVKLPALNTEINIATGIETSVMDLTDMIDGEGAVQMMPSRSIDAIQRRCLDITKAKELLGWTPKVDIREGINRLIEIKRK